MYTQSTLTMDDVSQQKSVTDASQTVEISSDYTGVGITNLTAFNLFVLGGDSTVVAKNFTTGTGLGSTMIPPQVAMSQVKVPRGSTHLALIFQTGGSGDVEIQSLNLG